VKAKRPLAISEGRQPLALFGHDGGRAAIAGGVSPQKEARRCLGKSSLNSSSIHLRATPQTPANFTALKFTSNDFHSMKIRLLTFLCSLPLLVVGEVASAADADAAKTDGIELVDIGGRKLRLLTRGQGSPTVIIEAGMGGAGVDEAAWRPVIDEIAKTNRVCIYDRAGLGKSDRPAKLPRTSLDVANDLNALLTAARVPGPYVLVGHSYGGMHVRMFATEYPEKVVGVVLVDSTHPDKDEKWLAALPPPAPDEPESLKKGRNFLTRRQSPAANPEQIDPKESDAQVRKARDLGKKPLVILTHASTFRLDKNLPEAVSVKMEEIFQSLQVEMKRLSTNSTLRQSAHGGHALHADDPQLVIQGIREVSDAVRAEAK
jgi:pimeloyl-ACP methyl ester carboxylesterase